MTGPSLSDAPLVHIPAEGVALDTIEQLALVEALKAAAWVQADAAKLLRISPRMMHHKIRVHAIELPSEHPNVKRYAWRRIRVNRSGAK
jgi:transcriptional regulator with GAF, ATPase, and Fis domain